MIIALAASTLEARSISFDLDSIATWGRFPRFCVDTYRWGDRFFNSYDSTRVIGTGRRFNIKVRTESLTDLYNFRFTGDPATYVGMVSKPVTTTGLWLTYMAVSVGYDLNVGQYFGGSKSRQKFNFQFNCSLFAADAFYMSNNLGTRINRFGLWGDMYNPRLDFSGIDNRAWGIDTYYFFNHRNYSQAAAFAFSKIQVASAGSWYAGLSYFGQEYDFDFNSLPDDMKRLIPLQQYDYRYHTRTDNYALRVGYGYNYVPAKGWLVAVSESPIIGLRQGWLKKEANPRSSIGVYNRFRASVVYNRNPWFAGVVYTMSNALFYDTSHTMLSSVMSIEAAVGYRFNLWKVK